MHMYSSSQPVYVFWLVPLVIINVYPITVFLIVLSLFSVGLFHLLCLLSKEVPLTFVVQLVW